MVIEINEKGSEAFYREAVNVTAQYRSFLKKPERKLSDMQKNLVLYLVLCGVLFALMVIMGMAWGFDGMTVAGTAVAGLAFLLSAAYLSTVKKAVKTMMEDPRTSVVTLDERGVELNKQDSQVVRLGWDNIAFVRSFAESLCIFSKDSTGLVIAVDKKHQDGILSYLRENHAEVRVL